MLSGMLFSRKVRQVPLSTGVFMMSFSPLELVPFPEVLVLRPHWTHLCTAFSVASISDADALELPRTTRETSRTSTRFASLCIIVHAPSDAAAISVAMDATRDASGGNPASRLISSRSPSTLVCQMLIPNTVAVQVPAGDSQQRADSIQKQVNCGNTRKPHPSKR